MMDKISVYSNTQSTVHSWLTKIPNRTFCALDKAIEYAGEHAGELRALEVFVHVDDHRYDIISGDELATLITKVCQRH
ncbi:hypothetical protein [Rhizobium leguminosarum]|uniref:Uncharacterized protein n=1 Tax=Rhizobium leguminosarum TaxID=384 RepID=A0A7W9ZMJ1_RHILE|nr:hypothetical protein [Rhizobium leguminosarum]MBB6219393.1 hypothetical protein [Rhizobium leguminosarum]